MKRRLQAKERLAASARRPRSAQKWGLVSIDFALALFQPFIWRCSGRLRACCLRGLANKFLPLRVSLGNNACDARWRAPLADRSLYRRSFSIIAAYLYGAFFVNATG